MMGAETQQARTAVRRLVGVLCDQTGLDFHKTWVYVYHEHHKRTGFHAVAASGGEGTHLDAVVEAGQLEELRETIKEMLMSAASRAAMSEPVAVRGHPVVRWRLAHAAGATALSYEDWVRERAEARADAYCRTCYEPYAGDGDGWDGECPACADRTYAEEQ